MKQKGFVLSVTILIITVMTWLMFYSMIHRMENIYFYETLIEVRR